MTAILTLSLGFEMAQLPKLSECWGNRKQEITP